jgi:hypothetical protein
MLGGERITAWMHPDARIRHVKMQVEAIRGIDCWMQSIFESEEAEEPLDDEILVAEVEQSTRTHMVLIVDDTLEGQRRRTFCGSSARKTATFAELPNDSVARRQAQQARAQELEEWEQGEGASVEIASGVELRREAVLAAERAEHGRRIFQRAVSQAQDEDVKGEK